MTIALVASNFAPAQATPDAQSEKVVTSSDSETAEETWKTQEASRKAKPANDLGGKISFSANDTSITAPAKNSGIVLLDAEHASPIGMSLPKNLSLDAARVMGDGVVKYDSAKDGGVDVSVQVYDDASVSIHTVIPNIEAPKTYEYDLTLPKSAQAIPQEDGSILFLGADEEFLGGVAAPWAKDATGKSIATSYEYADGVLRQYIDFDGSTAFPVTADPWMGIKIFKKISVDKYSGQPRVNLDLSWWGHSIYSGAAQGGGLAGIAAGQAILRGAGWTEATTWSSTARKALLGKASMKQQFDCHVAGSAFAGQWNLERFRVSRTVHWSYGVAVHHCNWKTATRY